MRRGLWTLAALLAGLACLGVERPPGLGDVVAVRHWSYPGYTRVVVELNREVETEVRRLPANREAGRPERLYLDLEGVWVGRGYAEGVRVDDGLLQGVRLGQNTLHSTRVVLDLERYDRHRLLELSDPDRVVIDVYGHRERHTAMRRASRGGGSSPDANLPMDLRPVRTVVLDAGHGGRDPGAIGVGGLREKDVTLDLARKLGSSLRERGFRVVYTRDSDRYISLEERTAIAESVQGDVFLSIHVNAARRRSVHGIETYYLDQNHDRHSVNLAARENGIRRGEVNDLQKILAKLHMEEVSPHSLRLARAVHGQLVSGHLKGRPQDLGVKKGPFYVLFLSNMPAILVEVGFLTNRQEAKLLRDRKYIESLATQIAEGVQLYRGEHETSLALGASR